MKPLSSISMFTARGSLRFLGKDYGRTLALVWEEVLKRSENVEEDYLLKEFLC